MVSENRFFIVAVLASVSIGCQAEVTKIMAKEIVIIKPYSLRSDEVLCSGIARAVGKSYIPNSTTLEPEEFCRSELKRKIVYPASTCNLKHMTGQCLDEIQKYKNKR